MGVSERNSAASSDSYDDCIPDRNVYLLARKIEFGAEPGSNIDYHSCLNPFFSDTSYQTYFDGAQFVHFLLGPATVALAVPLYRHFDKVGRSAVALLASLITGSITASASAVLIAWSLGGSLNSLISLAPKSVTAPVAMGITEQLGGLPSLTAVLVIATGILGAALGPHVLNILGIKNWEARGLAIGTASHGIGTARALQVNETAGAFSGLAMGINALATAILLPIIWQLFF